MRRALEKLHLKKSKNAANSRPKNTPTTEGLESQPPNPPSTTETPGEPSSAGESATTTSAIPQPENTPSTINSIQKGANLGLEILYEPPAGLSPAVDIIFVHGLTGNSYDTWLYRDGKSKTHWPSHLLGVDIPDARILSFGYDADIVGWWGPASNNRIGNHAEDLLGSVVRSRRKANAEGRSIIFVMHSLGGLVVQNSLDLSRSSPEPHLQNFESKTVGLVFMGTPHFGADKAQWGSLGVTMVNLVKRTNKPIVKVLDPGSEMLASIQKKFHQVLRLRSDKGQPMDIVCFYEQLALPVWGTIVEMRSAILPGYSSYGIHSTHTDMTKFRDAKAKGYEDVLGELQRLTLNVRGSETRITDLQKECLCSLYFDGLKSRHEEIRNPLEGTFFWVWEKDRCSFVNWLEQGRGLYWIRGRASSGKSTLMKYLVRSARIKAKQHFGKERVPIIVSHFIDGASSHSNAATLEGIARSLLWQVLCQDSRFFEFILPHYERLQRSSPVSEWDPTVLQEILAKMLSQTHHRPLWLFLDALDEYHEDLLDITDVCNTLVSLASPMVRICVSSRPEREIACSIGPTVRTQNRALELEEFTRSDIYALAAREINRLEDDLDEKSRVRLIEGLSARANGLIMWVKVASRDLVRSCWRDIGPDIELLLGRLDHLPEEINDLYHRILEKRSKQGLLLLGIVAFGKRSFTLRELAFILPNNMPGADDSVEERLRRNIEHYTGGLLEHRTGRVIFSHETVSSFVHNLFKQKPDSPPLMKANHSLVAACLALLKSFEHPGKVGNTHKGTRVIKNLHLLRELRSYAIQHWLHHVQSTASQYASIGENFVCPPTSNREVSHWHRMYLSRRWDHPTLGSNSYDAVAATLAFLLLSSLPLGLFSPETKEMGNSDNVSFRSVLRNPEEWKKNDLDFLISVDFAPGYSVSLHAEQVLNNQLGNVLCTISSPVNPPRPGKIEEQFDWMQLFLQSASSNHLLENPLTICRYKSSDFKNPLLIKREVNIDQSLLSHIKVVMWHVVRFEATRNTELTLDDLPTIADTDLQFPTPLHYASFNGLDIVVEKLQKCGADLNQTSKESPYGTPLIAAIRGLSERRYATLKNTTIETLLRLGASLEQPGNAGNLGTVTPLNAAVKLYTGYRKQVGIDPEDLKEVIQLFVQNGAKIDPATRAIARASPDLRRLFTQSSHSAFSSWVSQYSSTPPIQIPSSRDSFKGPGRPTNATIVGLGRPWTVRSPFRLVQTCDYSSRNGMLRISREDPQRRLNRLLAKQEFG